MDTHAPAASAPVANPVAKRTRRSKSARMSGSLAGMVCGNCNDAAAPRYTEQHVSWYKPDGSDETTKKSKKKSGCCECCPPGCPCCETGCGCRH